MSGVTDAQVEAALHGRVPGGSSVWVWIAQDDAFKPSQTARDVMRAALEAASRVSPSPMIERIVAAAVQRLEIDRAKSTMDEVVYVWMTYTQPQPARHPDILHAMPPLNSTAEVQGFLTSTGRFVTRAKAMGIAVAAGQVSLSKVTPDLFSENLW